MSAEFRDLARLDQAGWGAIFAEGADPAIREALQPLFELRGAQSRGRLRVLDGPDAYKPGETKSSYLARLGVPTSQLVTEHVPYYLLIVGSPEQIPLSFQQQLDLNYAVGRLCFEDSAPIERYAEYAAKVVTSERGSVAQERVVAVFAPKCSGDDHTRRLAERLAEPLARDLMERESSWRVLTEIGGSATKPRLAQLLGTQPPALLLAVSHAALDRQDDRSPFQGSVVCQEWPGPGSGLPLDPGMAFGADDVTETSGPEGLVALLWGSFTAGARPRSRSERPFLSRLPQRLLEGRGGSLAVLGLVDRLWSHSFETAEGHVREGLSRMVRAMLSGAPVGHAIQECDELCSGLSDELSGQLERLRDGYVPEEPELRRLGALWAAAQDLGCLVLLGDPAVRLPAAAQSYLS